MTKTKNQGLYGSSEVFPGKVDHLSRLAIIALTCILEPVSYLHQFSRTIVESKRGNETNQSVVNGLASRQQSAAWSSVKAPVFIPKSARAQSFSPFTPAQPPPPT